MRIQHHTSAWTRPYGQISAHIGDEGKIVDMGKRKSGWTQDDGRKK